MKSFENRHPEFISELAPKFIQRSKMLSLKNILEAETSSA